MSKYKTKINIFSKNLGDSHRHHKLEHVVRPAIYHVGQNVKMLGDSDFIIVNNRSALWESWFAMYMEAKDTLPSNDNTTDTTPGRFLDFITSFISTNDSLVSSISLYDFMVYNDNKIWNVVLALNDKYNVYYIFIYENNYYNSSLYSELYSHIYNAIDNGQYNPNKETDNPFDQILNTLMGYDPKTPGKRINPQNGFVSIKGRDASNPVIMDRPMTKTVLEIVHDIQTSVLYVADDMLRKIDADAYMIERAIRQSTRKQKLCTTTTNMYNYTITKQI